MKAILAPTVPSHAVIVGEAKRAIESRVSVSASVNQAGEGSIVIQVSSLTFIPDFIFYFGYAWSCI